MPIWIQTLSQEAYKYTQNTVISDRPQIPGSAVSGEWCSRHLAQENLLRTQGELVDNF